MRETKRNPANITREERNIDHRNRVKRIHQARPKHCHDSQRQQDIRKCHQHIDAAHHQIVGSSARIAGHETDRRANNRCDQRRCKSYRDRHPRAPYDTTQYIAPELIRSKKMSFAEHGFQSHCGRSRVRIGKRENRGQQNDEADQDQHKKAESRQSIAHQEPP